MATQQMFGYFDGQYYMIDESPNIVVPEGANYKKSGIQVTKNPNNEYEVDMYCYHSDLTTDRNSERVAFMKEFIINEKIKSIVGVNTDFLLTADYELFNKDGKCIANGALSTLAKSCNGIILDPVDSENNLMYHRLYVFDGRIEIPIPNIAKYGIKNCYQQYPYTLRINSVKATTTYGTDTYMIGLDEQVVHANDIDHRYHNAQYNLYHHMCDCRNEITHNNYTSRFLSNAKIGTNIIDAMAVPVTLEAPADYTEVVMADVPCATKDNSYTVKIDGKADQIILNVEVVVDNFNTVYDIDDIKKLVEANGGSMGDNDDTSTDDPYGGCKCDCCTKNNGSGSDTGDTDPTPDPGTGDSDKKDDVSGGDTTDPGKDNTGDGDQTGETPNPDTGDTGTTTDPDTSPDGD